MRVFRKDKTAGVCLDGVIFDHNLPDMSYYEVPLSESIENFWRVIFYREGIKVGSISRENIVGGISIMKVIDETSHPEFVYWEDKAWKRFDTLECSLNAYNRINWGDENKYVVFEDRLVADLPEIFLDFDLTYSVRTIVNHVIVSTDSEEDAMELMLKL